MTDALRAAIYTRVSTEDQAREEKVSLVIQRERAEAYCKAQEWGVAAVYEDAGVSGAKSDRPALAKMMHDAKGGHFQRVVFLKSDRLARKTSLLLSIWEGLEEAGVDVVSIQDGFDTSTPAGRAARNMLAVIAEFEREQIAERTSMGKVGAAKRGQYTGGVPAYGFSHDPEKKRLVINKAEATAVKRIYRWYLHEGLSHVKIAERLNAKRIPTKTLISRSADGVKKGWHAIQIGRILTDPIYKGEAYYGKTTRSKNGSSQDRTPEDEWVRIDSPAIVSEETWAAAHAKAVRNKRAASRNPNDKNSLFLLTGLVRCQPCGRVMVSHSKQSRNNGKLYRYRYFFCRGQHHGLTQCRPSEMVNAEKVEGAILDAIVEAYRDPQRVLEACRAYGEQLQVADAEQEGLIATLRQHITNAETERDRYITMRAKGTITDADVEKHVGRVDADVAQWREDLERLEQAAKQQARVKEVEESAFVIAAEIKENVEAMTLAERKEFVRALVEQVWIGAGDEVTIECVVPGLLPEVTATDDCASVCVAPVARFQLATEVA